MHVPGICACSAHPKIHALATHARMHRSCMASIYSPTCILVAHTIVPVRLQKLLFEKFDEATVGLSRGRVCPLFSFFFKHNKANVYILKRKKVYASTVSHANPPRPQALKQAEKDWKFLMSTATVVGKVEPTPHSIIIIISYGV